MSSKPTLSPEMRRCLDFIRRHDGQIHRHPGGYWAGRDWRSGTGESFRSKTVEALVARGLLTYPDWTTECLGRFPSRATLKEG